MAQPEELVDRYYTAPQTLVKVSGRRRLNLVITGQGVPTVILAPGMGATALHWMPVQHQIALKTRVVAFDQAGLGFSDPGPLPRTASSVVNDLRAALKAANIRPPYILAGWSAGGLYMQLFAFLHPEEVVGMVLVDSSSTHSPRRMFNAEGLRRFRASLRDSRRRYSRFEQMARAGALVPGTPEYDESGEFAALRAPGLAAAFKAALHSQLTAPGRWRALRSENGTLTAASSDEVAAARRPLGDIPLIMLSRGKVEPMPDETAAQAEARYKAWVELHDETAALSTRGVRRTIEDAGHAIQFDKPEVVIAAIEEVLAMARGQ